MSRVVFCLDCGRYLGVHQPNCAKEHLKEFPDHKNFLVKTLIDPLILNNPDEWFKRKFASSTDKIHVEDSTDNEPIP